MLVVLLSGVLDVPGGNPIAIYGNKSGGTNTTRLSLLCRSRAADQLD